MPALSDTTREGQAVRLQDRPARSREGGKRRWRIVGEELEPAEQELIEEAATRALRGESLRSAAMDWNERGVKTVGGGTWQGSMIRRVLMSPRIAGLKEHRGEIVGEATWPAIIDRATHDRLVRLLGTRAADPRTTAGRASTRWLACSTAGLAADQYVAGYVIEMWKSPRALNIAQYDNGRMKRISKISSEMAQLREETNEALRMKLRGEVDLPTYRTVTRELDAAHDQLAREHKSLTSEAAMPELPDPSLAWEDLSAVDRRALTEMLVDKIIIERHPSKIGKTSATATCRIAAVKKPAPRPITMNATAGWRAMMRSNACCPPVPGPRPAWA